jgi:hypothetical protein
MNLETITDSMKCPFRRDRKTYGKESDSFRPTIQKFGSKRGLTNTLTTHGCTLGRV